MARTKQTARKARGVNPNRDIDNARKRNEAVHTAQAVKESLFSFREWQAKQAVAPPRKQQIQQPGCSKCRFSARGCAKCVVGFKRLK
jgi:hypothetical protein